MNKRITTIGLLVAAVLAVFTLAAACGGDGDDGGSANGGDSANGNGGGGALTLEEFYGQLEVLSQDWEDEGNALDKQASEDFEAAESEEETVAVFISFIEDFTTATTDFVDGLDDLNAPAEAADAMDEAVAAGREVVDMFENIQVVLETVDTLADATALMEGPGFTDASDRFADACFALEDIAGESGLTVDLLCG